MGALENRLTVVTKFLVQPDMCCNDVTFFIFWMNGFGLDQTCRQVETSMYVELFFLATDVKLCPSIFLGT